VCYSYSELGNVHDRYLQGIPHGVCLASSPTIVFSSFSIALAYFVIPSILSIAASRFRMPVPAIKALFGVFIRGCGGTYVVDIWYGAGCCLANYVYGKRDHIGNPGRCPFMPE